MKNINSVMANLRHTSSRRLILVSAAFLLQIGAAQAADITCDVHSQARALLSAATTDRLAGAVVSNSVTDRAASMPTLDAQESAHRLLLGTLSVGNAHEETTSTTEKSDDRLPQGDAQAMARRMILGGTVG